MAHNRILSLSSFPAKLQFKYVIIVIVIAIFSFRDLTVYQLQKISIHLNFPHDDSYTPSTLAIRAGTGPSDLQDVRVVTLDKPDGWITFDVSSEPNEDGDGLYDYSNCYLSLTLPGIYS